MDVKEFQDSRNSELDVFSKQYSFLKQQYSSTLSSAIQESDPAKQQELIQQVQQLNTQMADEIRTILNTLNKGAQGFDPKTLDDLTADLIQYQKDYAEIERTKDRVNTLKLIHTSSELFTWCSQTISRICGEKGGILNASSKETYSQESGTCKEGRRSQEASR